MQKHLLALVRSWLIPHHADRSAMGKAGKARKAGKAQARQNELWMAYDNISDWFGFWEDFLLEYYFATDVPDPVSELIISSYSI